MIIHAVKPLPRKVQIALAERLRAMPAVVVTGARQTGKSTLAEKLVSACAVNRTKRLIKAPKIYWGDPGLALHLAEMDEPAGAHLENIVLQDLLT